MRMLIKLFLVGVILSAFPLAYSKGSYAKDCRKMPTQIEMNLCLKEKMAALDQELAEMLLELSSNPAYSKKKIMGE